MKKLIGILVGTGLLMTSHLQSQPNDKIILEKISEPVQNAFTILKPQGWITEGGVVLWDHRWVDDQGNVICTSNQGYNPNLDLELQMDGFKKSSPKK